MDLKDILLDYYHDRKSLDDAIKTLSLFSIEYIESNVAQLDVNRDLRKSVPEVVLALNKKNLGNSLHFKQNSGKKRICDNQQNQAYCNQKTDVLF